MRYNNLQLVIYSQSTTPIVDPRHELGRREGLRFATGNPGGKFLECGFFLPGPVTRWTEISEGQRIGLYNGLTMVYEGFVDSIVAAVGAGSEQGLQVTAIGPWGYYLKRRRWRKLWADNRITDDVWKWQTASPATGADKCTLDRNNRLRFIPKAEAWTSGQAAIVRAAAPVGETWKQLTYDYTLAEGGQAWQINAQRSTDSSTWTKMTAVSGETYAAGTTTEISADGSGSIDVTLGTPSRYVDLRFVAAANQTPTADGAILGEFRNVMLYSETGAINLTEIIKDVMGKLSGYISDYDGFIGANTLSLAPFIYDRWTPLADILLAAAGFGDSSNQPWAVGLLESEAGPDKDGLPVFFAEYYLPNAPNPTRPVYAVRIGEENVIPGFQLEPDFGDVWNWIIVEYTDPEGNNQVLTPDDTGYETLTDADSVSEYSERDYVLDAGVCTATMALAAGVRFLEAHKDPPWRLLSPLSVVSWIRTEDGNRFPVCQVQAGDGLLIEDYTDQEVLIRIASTEYDDETQTLTITAGAPEALLYDQYAAPAAAFEAPEIRAAATGKAGAGDVKRTNWKRLAGLKPGTPEWEAASGPNKGWKWRKARRKKKTG